MQPAAVRNHSAAMIKKTQESREFVIFQLHGRAKVAIRQEAPYSYTTLRQNVDGSWSEVDCLYSWAVFNAELVDVLRIKEFDE